ncbi:MAG TPA: TadE family protein [Thermomicrobiaceae bacterium]|nr:TadE family protein [Thermomicrobiaceae bacterium]
MARARAESSHGRERTARRGLPAQAMVEFALVGTAFLLILLGSLDFGRAIFMYSDLQNGVREGARYARVHPTDTSGIKDRVIDKTTVLGLSSSDITVSCSGSCDTGDNITVTASIPFQAITQQFLGISPITLRATATDVTD